MLVAQAKSGGARLRIPPRLTWIAGERDCNLLGLLAGDSGKSTLVGMTATTRTNGLTVTQAGQWSDGPCLPEPPWPGFSLAPSAVQMTSGPRTSSTRAAPGNGASENVANALLKRAMIASHAHARLYRRNMAER